VVVRSVNIERPEITLEASLHGSNLGKIRENLKASSGADREPGAKDDKSGKKLEVDEFVIAGGKVHVSFVGLAGKTANLPLPDIHLKDLGTGPEGITAAELTEKVLTEVLDKAIEVSAGAVGDLGRQGADLTKDIGSSAAEAAGRATKGIGGLFKKR
jgi:hypothetical protein